MLEGSQDRTMCNWVSNGCVSRVISEGHSLSHYLILPKTSSYQGFIPVKHPPYLRIVLIPKQYNFSTSPNYPVLHHGSTIWYLFTFHETPTALHKRGSSKPNLNAVLLASRQNVPSLAVTVFLEQNGPLKVFLEEPCSLKC